LTTHNFILQATIPTSFPIIYISYYISNIISSLYLPEMYFAKTYWWCFWKFRLSDV